MRELDEKQELDKGVVFQGKTLRKASALRWQVSVEKAGLGCCRHRHGNTFPGCTWQGESHTLAPALQVFQGVYARLAHDGGVFHLRRDVRSGQGELRFLGKGGGEPLARNIITVSCYTWKDCLEIKSFLKGTDASRLGTGRGLTIPPLVGMNEKGTP